MKKLTEKINIRRFGQGGIRDFEDTVIVERPVALVLNGELVSELTCTGVDVRELVTGHIFCGGYISSPDEIHSVFMDDRARSVIVRASDAETVRKNRAARKRDGDGFEKPRAAFKPDYPLVIKTFARFQEMSELYKETGSAHSAALLDMDYEFRFFYEDMGRHNAVDKVIGKALMDGVDLSRCMLIVSSRMPEELMFKAYMARIPAVFSVSAPTLQSVALARRSGITLIGMFRDGRVNIYND